MMSKNAAYKLQHTRYSIAVGALLVFASIGTATAQQMGATAQQRYQQELAACGSGRSSQDVATCQKEARNALEEASRGGLSNAPNAAQNSVQRCDVFSGDERTVCEARVRGEGQVQGSVEGGGILRETVTPIPAK